MNITQEEKNQNAIDMVIALTVEELARDENCDPVKLMPKFLASKTAKMLYDESSKLWWNGPSDIAEMFKAEPCAESAFALCKLTKNKAIPAIRFKGFTDTWEQYRFSEMYEKVSEKNDLTYGVNDIISVANMYFKPDSYVTNLDYLKTYNVFHLGDIAFEGNKSKNFTHGRFVENTIGNGIVSHVFDVFRPIMTYDLLFWKYAINNERLMRKILIRCTKASTMMTNLVASDFLAESFFVPSVKEQERIGTLLHKLDRLITLHQRKLDKLHNVKKSLLEKMFPRNGADVPEIRFKGFTYAWEHREFETIAIRSSTITSDNTLPCLEYEDIISGTGELNKNINRKDCNKSGLEFHCGDVLYGKLRPYLHNWLLPLFDGIAVGDFWVLQPQNTDSNFVYRLIQSSRFDEVANQSTGTKMPRADWKLISKTEFAIPTVLSEQQKIGAFFSHLDRLITLHQRKSEKLRQIKKSLLEKMFV